MIARSSLIKGFGPFLFLTLLNGLVIHMIRLKGYHQLHAENGLLENAQAFLLMLAILTYAVLSMRETVPLSLLHQSLALLSFSFLLRELDLELLPLPLVVRLLGSGLGRTILLLALWMAMAWKWIGCIKDKRGFTRRWFYNRSFLLLMIAAQLLMLSELIEKNIFLLPDPQLFEEMAESNAYLLLLLAAFSNARIRFGSEKGSVSRASRL